MLPRKSLKYMFSMSSVQFKSTVKPPNVLVLDSKDTKDIFLRTRETLQACLGYDRYVIYPLQVEDIVLKNTPWKDNCMLLIAPEIPQQQQSLPSEVMREIDEYLRAGGRCLSMNTQVTSLILHSDTVESSDGEKNSILVTVHPVKTSLQPFYSICNNSYSHFSSTDPLLSSEVLANASPSAPSNGGIDTVPVVSLVSSSNSSSIVSSVELLAPDVTKMAELEKVKETGEERQEFLKSAFVALGLECGGSSLPSLSHVYLASTNNNARDSLLSSLLHDSPSSIIKGSEVSTIIYTDDFTAGTPVDPIQETSETTSVLIGKPSKAQLKALDFDSEQFYQHLQTKSIGKCLLISPVVTSTQTFFTGNMTLTSKLEVGSGLVFVAGQQTKGKGRGGNVWISPRGCMMFSLPLILPSSARLVKKLSMLQHMVALSVVSAIRTMEGYENLPVMIKWPNDIYYGRQAKLGGNIVTTFTMGQETTAVIGCGVNIDNQYPTVSLNDCIRLYNKDKKSAIPSLTLEGTLAAVLNKLEMYLSLYEEWGFQAIERLYYQYWMHSGEGVSICSKDGQPLSATITGIDEYGYLRVRPNDGRQTISLQPDGNTFDIMKGLIRMKSS